MCHGSDAELVAILGEPLGDIDPHALLDVVQDLLVAALVADQQESEAVIAKRLERCARHIGLGVARPDDAELAKFSRDRLGAWQVVGECVVVEEEFLDLWKRRLRPLHFLDDMADANACDNDGRRPSAAKDKTCSAICSLDQCKTTCKGA